MLRLKDGEIKIQLAELSNTRDLDCDEDLICADLAWLYVQHERKLKRVGFSYEKHGSSLCLKEITDIVTVEDLPKGDGNVETQLTPEEKEIAKELFADILNTRIGHPEGSPREKAQFCQDRAGLWCVKKPGLPMTRFRSKLAAALFMTDFPIELADRADSVPERIHQAALEVVPKELMSQDWFQLMQPQSVTQTTEDQGELQQKKSSDHSAKGLAPCFR